MKSHESPHTVGGWTFGQTPNQDGSVVWRGFHPDPRIVLIPLLGHARESSQTVDYRLLQRLVVTVQLEPALVQQRWILDVADAADINTFAAGSGTAVASNVSFGAGSGYDCVQYHLPRTTINKFTDGQGLPRVPTDCEDTASANPVFTRLTELILPSVGAPELFSSSFMDHFVMLFCAQVVHLRNLKPTEKRVHRGGLSTWQKRRAIEILSKNPYSDIRLASVAAECGLSVSHFARSFKTSFGQPVHRWLIGQRVARAKVLLATTNESLVDVAFHVGFSDQASFNRTFARLTGTSPGRWRKDFKE